MPTTDPAIWKTLAQAISGQAADLGAFDADELIAAIRRHGVELLLYARLREGGVIGLPASAWDELKARTHAAVAADMMLNEATRKTLDLLGGNGIPALLLKGMPMAHLHYPESWLRLRCDTDLLIDEDQVEAAARVLALEGFQVSGLNERKQASRQFLAALPMGGGHHVHFDMHWKLSNRVLFRDAVLFEPALEHSQPVATLGEHARALSDIELLIHACIHRIGHGRNTERDRLLWLFDIHLLIEALDEQQLNKFRQTAWDKKIGVLCADALRTCEELFGSRLPPGYLEKLEAKRKNEPSARLVHASRLGWAWADLSALPGLKRKAGYAWELLFH